MNLTTATVNFTMLPGNLFTSVTTVDNYTAILEPAPSGVCGSNATSAWKLESPVCSTRFQSFFIFVLVTLLMTLTIIVTLFGNILVLLALYRYRSLQTMSNCLIGNLAVSDLTIAITVLPISTGNDVLGYWVFGETMCTVWLCIDVLICTASIWGLCTIAFDRYTATVYPVWYHEKRSRRKALAYISFVWVISTIISFSPFIGWTDMMPKNYSYNAELNRHECILFMTESYVLYSATGSFILPLVLMVFLYTRIFIVLHRQSRTLKAKANLYYAQKSANRHLERSVTKETNLDGNGTQGSNSFFLEDLEETVNETSVVMNNREEITDLTCPSDPLTPTITSDPLTPTITSDPLTPTTELTPTTTTQLQPSLPPTPQPNGISNNNHVIPKSKSDNGITANQIVHASERSLEGRRTKSADVLCESSPPVKLERCGLLTQSMKRRFELREQRATKRMVTIMACFIVCWIPFLFMYLLRSFCKTCHMDGHGVSFIIWLGYANSGLNPILYTVFNDDFRTAFKKILHIPRHRKTRLR